MVNPSSRFCKLLCGATVSVAAAAVDDIPEGIRVEFASYFEKFVAVRVKISTTTRTVEEVLVIILPNIEKNEKDLASIQ